ncbi:MAG: anaerobic sulfite reductase subunit A [Oscillospiraceae bacterium]|nr:anaerobic sulfite reductase subunit A [Oscillospiraceae bacterium]
MGYVMDRAGFAEVIAALLKDYRIFAPVRKKGAGRFTDVDAVIYDEIRDAGEIELELKSDYAPKEFLTPLSETLLYFTEDEVKESDFDERPVLLFGRSCDLHSLRRLDQIYLNNGPARDPFYERRRKAVRCVLIGCGHSYDNCFCVSMGSNRCDDGYVFSVDLIDDRIHSNVLDGSFIKFFSEVPGAEEKDVLPRFVTENDVKVEIPEEVPREIVRSGLWDEYTSRCINCGRCNFVCPTCTCYTMQDVFYSDNGRAGERRRVGASCMVDGYTDVAGGGQYRRKNGERMRFKVLHKISDFKKRFGYQMCVGCGRCDDICPEYISFSNIINKVNAASREVQA